MDRRCDCIALADVIQERIVEIKAQKFQWTKTVPLLPGVDFEWVLDSSYRAADAAYEDLGQSRPSADRIVAVPLTDPPRSEFIAALEGSMVWGSRVTC